MDFDDVSIFFVLNDISAEFVGFLRPISSQTMPTEETKILQGNYAGVLREPISGDLIRVEVEVENAPIQPVESRKEIDERGYSEDIRRHLYRLEFDQADREYWRAGEEPAADGTEVK